MPNPLPGSVPTLVVGAGVHGLSTAWHLAAEGRGAVSLDGRLIDAASIRMAENLLAKLEQIEARRAGIALRQVTAAG